MTTNFEELEKLAKLKEQGILSDEEFEIEKRKILSGESENIKSSSGDNIQSVQSKTYYDSSNDSFFQKIFSSKGRINRREYFVYNALLIFFQFLIGIIILLFFEYILKEEINDGMIKAISLPGYIIGWIIIIKRLHDMNFSGWWSLFFPIWFIIPFVSGTKGDNRFGNESKVNDNILNPLFIVSLFILIIGFIGIIVFAILLSEEEKIPVNTNTQVETQSPIGDNEGVSKKLTENLQELSEIINKSLPVMQSDGIKIDSTDVRNSNTLNFNLTLISILKSDISDINQASFIETIKDEKNEVIKGLLEDKERIEIIFSDGGNMSYTMYDKNHTFLYDYIITPEDYFNALKIK